MRWYAEPVVFDPAAIAGDAVAAGAEQLRAVLAEVLEL